MPSEAHPIPSTPAAVDALIVGAGQAGLGTSYFLKQFGIGHVVLERQRIGESWRSQRWDSFKVNSPNALNSLPGVRYQGMAPDGFYSRDELVGTFEQYARRFGLPVLTGIEVTSVEPASGGRGFAVRAATTDGDVFDAHAGSIVVASGIMTKPKVPPVAEALPPGIRQLHVADYRSPAALPDGSVVVVGSGQSGCQIAEELNQVGRQVYLCTSKVGRLPRRHRGRDTLLWLRDSGFMDVARADLFDPAICRSAQAQVSGVGPHGHTLSLQKLWRDGVTLLGRLLGVDGNALVLGDDLANHIRFADAKSAEFKREIDAYIARYGIPAPPPEDDPADRPWSGADDIDAPPRLDLAEAGAGAVIWCTGFTGDFSWLRLPVLDGFGQPRHKRGVAPAPGLYFVGFPWLHKRKSGVICGIEEDAGYIARQIANRLALAA